MREQLDYIPTSVTLDPLLWGEISAEGWEIFGDEFTHGCDDPGQSCVKCRRIRRYVDD